MTPKITIAIPAYNAEKTIEETLKSCINQRVKHKEILVLDDGSIDWTAHIVRDYSLEGVRLIRNPENRGIGRGLEKLLDEANGKYVVFMCSDDVFTNPYVCDDIVKTFENNLHVGVIGRYYYQFMNGHKGAIMVCRDKNIFTSSCNPSGMAFRKQKRGEVRSTNKIFIEMPTIVKNYLNLGWHWTMLEYDTISARIHPSTTDMNGNTGTKESYYNGSMYENWFDLMGEPLDFPQGYVQIKNRSPRNWWHEVRTSIILDYSILIRPLYWFYFLVSLLPRSITIPLSNFYRHRITRMFVKIIERGEYVDNAISKRETSLE